MTERQAKEILMLYRPGTSDENDAGFAEALAMVRQSPELAAWFENHCAVQSALRSRVREIPVPAAFKEQIVSEIRARKKSEGMRRTLSLVALSIVIAAAFVVGMQLMSRHRAADDQSFAIYRSRMLTSVLLAYNMELVTNNVAEIRSHLANRGAPQDWKISGGLTGAEVTGCGVMDWHGKRVSMVCFRTGKPLEPGKISDMYLIITDSSSLRDPVEQGTPKVEPFNDVMTATWSSEGKVYMLAVEGDEAMLRRSCEVISTEG